MNGGANKGAIAPTPNDCGGPKISSGPRRINRPAPGTGQGRRQIDHAASAWYGTLRAHGVIWCSPAAWTCCGGIIGFLSNDDYEWAIFPAGTIMTVLVTGGAGYIGSHMVHELRDAGEAVVVLDNLSTGFEWAVAEGVPLIVGDTGDQSAVAAAIARHEVEAIIHFAASAVVPDSVADPLGYYRNNTANSRTLIETAIKAGVRHFIFSSTAAVYGNPVEMPVPEDAPLAPMSPYGSSKLMTEIMLRDASHAHG